MDKEPNFLRYIQSRSFQIQRGPSKELSNSIRHSRFKAWFQHPLKIKKENLSLIFGHWAALGGITNVPDIIAIDTGCVWGYKLSAYRLEDDQIFSYDQIKNNK